MTTPKPPASPPFPPERTEALGALEHARGERLRKLSRWLLSLRANARLPGLTGGAFAGIVEAFDERDMAPELLARDILGPPAKATGEPA